MANKSTWVLVLTDDDTNAPIGAGSLRACLVEAGRRARADGLRTEALLETTPDERVVMVDGEVLLYVRRVPVLG